MTFRSQLLLALTLFVLTAGMPLQVMAETTTVTTTLKIIVDLEDEIKITRSNINLDPYEGKEDIRSEFDFSLAIFGPDRKKVTARLEDPLPQGVTLSMELSAPDGGRSTGLRSLSTRPVTLLKNLSGVGFYEGIGTLTFSATVNSPIGEDFSRIILEIVRY